MKNNECGNTVACGSARAIFCQLFANYNLRSIYEE